MEHLIQLFEPHVNDGICLAFSGGVDSSLVLAAACQAVSRVNPARPVLAVTFETRLHPQGDTEEARALAQSLGARHLTIPVDEFSDTRILSNPKNRCYLCKSLLFRSLLQAGRDAGYTWFCEGSNLDDTKVYRPGLQAVREAGVHSPLIEGGLTKNDVRRLAAEAGLKTASKPSTPCMATRLPYDTPFDYELLSRIHQGEDWLRNLGFYNVRLRFHAPILRIEIDKADFNRFMDQHEAITRAMKDLGFLYITLDLEGFRSGSMDI
ncbi:ATP-dependent sacrificial sulfur transferase LarE [Frisingicoccus sp.]|jgi:uncharacterized protein|uniref:ATP-dependent sacrificial sulfur transferase LarE n=1 Tax=Frisingicoccus sp. TaxID=1918627 RepID=UPI003AB8E669